MNNTLLGQNAVSGYIDIEKEKSTAHIVYLSQLQTDQISGDYVTIPIASSLATEDGFFAFDKNLLSTKEQLYKLHLTPLSPKEKDTLSKTIKEFQLFILSKNDTIYFDKSKQLFTSHTSNSKANSELQKLRSFEARYENLNSDFDTKKYLLETKGYIKDSLQILLVKLIGIKKLDDQGLLEKDAKANPEYYLNLIKQLKSSDLDPITYLYLENKIRIITQEITNTKYKLSLGINILAVLIISILTFFGIKYFNRLKKIKPIPLSKQEKIIKDLILSGKSNKEISNELFISLSTVKTHISNIYSKLNVSNRKELLLKK